MNLAFHPLVSWSFYFGILIGLILIAGIPLYLQRKKGESGRRILVRILFSILFILTFSMAVLRPSYLVSSDSNGVLVYGKGVEKEEINFWKDSLQLRKPVRIEDFDQNSEKVYLLGNEWEREELYPLKGSEINWIKPERDGSISTISWKGFLRKGEKQRLSYSIFSKEAQSKLRLGAIDGGQKILNAGWNSGILEFPVSGLGRMEIPLIMESDTLAWVRFYVGKVSPKKYHFIAGFPNPELRNLSQWLRNKGENVTEEIQLSRETQLRSETISDSLEVIFLDAGKLGRKDVLDQVKNGDAALVIWNLRNPSETIAEVNRLVGTNFQVEKTSQESQRTLENGTEALPFTFVGKIGQKTLLEGSWAVQYPFGKPVSISLVNATYPIFLQGKESEYEDHWGEVLSAMEPEEKKSWKIEAPYLTGMESDLEFFQQDSLPTELIAFGDTIFLSSDPVNSFGARGKLQTMETGWIQLAEDLEVFGYSPADFPLLFGEHYIRELNGSNSSVNPAQKESRQTISPWIWLAGMLLSLGMLWLEPKLDY
mgnify:FL=1